MRVSIQYLFSFLFFIFSYVSLAAPLEGYSTELKPEWTDIVGFNPEKGEAFKTKIAWTRLIEYDFDTKELTNEHVVGLAKQFWEEMVREHDNWVNGCDPRNGQRYARNARPPMVSVAVFDNKAYMATVIKQNQPNIVLQHQDATLTRAVTVARDEWLIQNNDNGQSENFQGEQAHKNRAVCSEVMVISMILKNEGKTPKQLVNEDKKEIRVVSWGTGPRKNAADARLYNPCDWKHNDATKNPDNKIGCMQLSLAEGMTPILEGTEPIKVDRVPKELKNVALDEVWSIGRPGHS